MILKRDRQVPVTFTAQTAARREAPAPQRADRSLPCARSRQSCCVPIRPFLRGRARRPVTAPDSRAQHDQAPSPQRRSCCCSRWRSSMHDFRASTPTSRPSAPHEQTERGAETPRSYRRVRCAAGFDQSVEHRFSDLRRRGRLEARPHAAGGVRCKGELAYQQQASADVDHRPVHAPCVVREHAVTQQALAHSPHLRMAVARLDADQRQQPASDCANFNVIHAHARRGHALDQGKHGGRVGGIS